MKNKTAFLAALVVFLSLVASAHADVTTHFSDGFEGGVVGSWTYKDINFGVGITTDSTYVHSGSYGYQAASLDASGVAGLTVTDSNAAAKYQQLSTWIKPIAGGTWNVDMARFLSIYTVDNSAGANYVFEADLIYMWNETGYYLLSPYYIIGSNDPVQSDGSVIATLTPDVWQKIDLGIYYDQSSGTAEIHVFLNGLSIFSQSYEGITGTVDESDMYIRCIGGNTAYDDITYSTSETVPTDQPVPTDSPTPPPTATPSPTASPSETPSTTATATPKPSITPMPSEIPSSFVGLIVLILAFFLLFLLFAKKR